MGEMVRRLEYEQRARNLMKQTSRDKLIGKEYTQSVRAANISVSRSMESTVKKVNMEQKSFRERFSKNMGNIHAFKRTLSFRSVDFADDKFIPDGRLVLPPLASGNQNGGTSRRPEEKKMGPERRQSCLSIADLIEKSKQNTEVNDSPAVSAISDLPANSARRNSSGIGRRLSVGSQGDGRSFRVLKEKFLPNRDGELDSRAKRILDCKAAEQRRGSFLNERIQQLCMEVEQT